VSARGARSMRARVRGQTSLGFGVHRTADVYQPPFGGRHRPHARVAPRSY
jgi:hypothetical protein